LIHIFVSLAVYSIRTYLTVFLYEYHTNFTCDVYLIIKALLIWSPWLRNEK